MAPAPTTPTPSGPSFQKILIIAFISFGALLITGCTCVFGCSLRRRRQRAALGLDHLTHAECVDGLKNRKRELVEMLQRRNRGEHVEGFTEVVDPATGRRYVQYDPKALSSGSTSTLGTPLSPLPYAFVKPPREDRYKNEVMRFGEQEDTRS
ncbi:hypothetical protein FA95DRAFT_1571097 [Auriscalpium vulgare]|uniref:Uncharacterized protein n=1 Tax=Auriscalpium vulgare TaxID=40419 RepID=A0ACB8S1J5_9AGAM|nr:hypothetical protein FA95DRAFT_1571097 [Auriscalpium vulgare]